MTQPRKEQLNILRAYWSVFTYTATAGTTLQVLPGGFVSSSITQTSGGDPSSNPPVRGIVTSGIGGFVRLKKVSDSLTLDESGTQIFGRLTFSAGNYTVTYKRMSGGAEISATLPGAGSYSVQMIFPEVMNFGEIPASADIIYGSSQELLTSNNTIVDLIVTGNTTLGDASSDTIITNARLASDLVPNVDNSRSLGTTALRFRNANFSNFVARNDTTDTVKSSFTATGIAVSGTTFSIDGNNDINIGTVSATAVNIGHVGITTTVTGSFVANNNATINGTLTVNGTPSIFNGDVTITGTLTVGSFSFTDLVVTGNTTLGDSFLDDILLNGAIRSNIIPRTSDLFTIGSSAFRFSEANVTKFIARSDDVGSLYTIYDADSLLSTSSFDIDGYGTLFIGVTHIDEIHLGRFGITTTVDGYFTVNPGALINTIGTGNIDLPNNINSRFRIEGIPVGPEVTAVNLDTLTDGSNADSLHTHSAFSVIITGIAGETINPGELVAWDGYINGALVEPRIFKARALDGYGEITNVVGVADGYADGYQDGYYDGYGGSLTVLVVGEASIPDIEWDAIPNVSDVGKLAYLSEISGNWTLTAPVAIGSYVQKCGVVTRGGSGLVKVSIQIGDSVLIN